ncbi:hypothetical protein Tco_0347695 [Tanacetum coccineum]
MLRITISVVFKMVQEGLEVELEVQVRMVVFIPKAKSDPVSDNAQGHTWDVTELQGTLDGRDGLHSGCFGGDANISLYDQLQVSGTSKTNRRPSAIDSHRDDEMVDDFVKSEEAFKSTELPREEHSEKGQGMPYKGPRPPCTTHDGGPPKVDGYNAYNWRDHYQPYVSPRQQGRRYKNRRFKNRRQEVDQLSLESLVKRPKEILATELQLQLPLPPLLVGTPRRKNLDRYCDYHRENGHYTNNFFQLKRQLEVALESGKLNHLVKDVRQRGGNRGHQAENNSSNGKIINMVYEKGDSRKRKFQTRRDEDWLNAPITFPPIPSDDVSDEPLIIEAEVEGYLVQRVFVDQGAAVQVMFEHCFLIVQIWARSGFDEIEGCFG